MLKIIEKLDNMNYKDRLIEEYLTLESRIKLIESFIKGETFKQFSYKYKHFMKMQFMAMKVYFKYLKKRMIYLDINENIINFYISEENAKAAILKEQLKRLEKNIEEKKLKKETKKSKKKNDKAKEN